MNITPPENNTSENLSPERMPVLRDVLLALLVMLVAASRLIPHPPNFNPVAAVALFSGAYFASKTRAFLIPLIALFVSDLGLTLFSGKEFSVFMRLVVYGSFSMVIICGFYLRENVTVKTVLLGTLCGSLLFFIISNFFVWARGGMYPLTFSGLMKCYVAAIPFFRNSLTGNFVYAGAMFGMVELAKNSFPEWFIIRSD